MGALAPGFGALNTTTYTPMLNANLPEKIWFYDIDNAANQATFHALDSGFTVKIPMQPFLGCIGVAPAGGEARSSIVPAEYGGNMDAPEARPGYTLYLPVNAPGALLYLGDGHAAQGDGEVAGTAIEVPCAWAAGGSHQAEEDRVAALRERDLADGGRRLPAADIDLARIWFCWIQTLEKPFLTMNP